MTYEFYLLLLPLRNQVYRQAFDPPSDRIHRRCLIVENITSRWSIEGGKRFLEPVVQLAWVECLNHMMHISFRTACLTSKIGRKIWNHITLQHFLSSESFQANVENFYKGKFQLFCSTHLKKSSLQNNWPFRMKHFSFSCAWHSLHCKHFACHVRSDTLSINRSNINSWQPPHLGIVAE